MPTHIIDLIWNEIESNAALVAAEAAPHGSRRNAQVAMAERVAQGAADAMRQRVWELCAEGLRRRAVG